MNKIIQDQRRENINSFGVKSCSRQSEREGHVAAKSMSTHFGF